MKNITIVIATLLAAIAAWTTEAANPGSYLPLPEALSAMKSDSAVRFEQPRRFFYAFMPRNADPAQGVVIYPGGLVDFRAYAPVARDLAAAGYLVAVVEMPADIAFLGYDRATLIRIAYPRIKRWAVGGHSLGGVAAALYAERFPRRLDGLFLWASYPAEGTNLQERNLAVASIYGTKDGLSTPAEVLAATARLPPSARLVSIDGANHTQFASYWDGQNPAFVQPGDNPALLTREQQRTAIVAAMVEFLRRL